jgi:hypothetical protein
MSTNITSKSHDNAVSDRPFKCCSARRDEVKTKEATELGKSKGYPLFFTTEPEE